MNQPKALVTGITGQDGSYLAEYLLEIEYKVIGMVRRASTDNNERIKHLLPNPDFSLSYGDLSDFSSILSLINKEDPHEIYNLAAQSDVGASFKLPEMTGDVTGIGVLRILEAIRQSGKTDIRLYQASSSELFGKVQETPQRETTPFYPRSPYGIAKLYAYWAVKNYRESYGIFACNGILFNHESPRRGDKFVTQKIVKGMINCFQRKQHYLSLGNLDSKRDWGFAGDYVVAMHKMLQMDTPDDYVIATGETHSVREFVEEVAKLLGISLAWRGTGVNEEGYDTKTGIIYVKIDPEFWRPAEVDLLLGDASKAKAVLNWEPMTKFSQLVKIMVEAQLK